MKRLAWMAWLGFLGLGTLFQGCSSATKSGALFGEASIGEIHMLTMPMALNLDQIPGADGFAVKVYAVDQARPKSVAITSGSLEILVYDGVLDASSLATNTPISTWRFDAEGLVAYGQKTSVGFTYALTPTWKDQKPRREKITVMACYAPAEHHKNQRRVCSSPTTVTVALPASFK